jgi:hypothetical protein
VTTTDVQAPAAGELKDEVASDLEDCWENVRPPSVHDLVDLRDIVRRALRTRRVGGRELSADEFAVLELVDEVLIRNRLAEPGPEYSRTPPSERPRQRRAA